jgi:hypothetical protein
MSTEEASGCAEGFLNEQHFERLVYYVSTLLIQPKIGRRTMTMKSLDNGNDEQ